MFGPSRSSKIIDDKASTEIVLAEKKPIKGQYQLRNLSSQRSRPKVHVAFAAPSLPKDFFLLDLRKLP